MRSESERAQGHERVAVSPRLLSHCARQNGNRGAVSSAHPLATEAAVSVLRQGGSAVDSAIAAQAVICVVMPQAAGLGGDVLALVHSNREIHAFNGVGRSPATSPKRWATDGGASVTVPGIAPGWLTMHGQFGRLPLSVVLESATTIACEGFVIDGALEEAVTAQRPRLARYGGSSWNLLELGAGDTWIQPELGEFLRRFAAEASDAQGSYYQAQASAHITGAAHRYGGGLTGDDFTRHRTTVTPPIHTPLGESTVWVQPPSSQGILLAMAAKWLHENPAALASDRQHVLAELIDAVFGFRDRVGRGEDNLAEPLYVNLERASRRGGARSYLHTAGIAVADSEGMVVSSLISVFDDFGSAVFVPELGIVLNNRGAGFTSGDNAPQPNAFPVHTLAPAMLTEPNGNVLALATPGADGQVQTLLQVITRLLFDDNSLPEAIAAPRWRSQETELLVEDDHPDIPVLENKGHHIRVQPAGDDLFGAVVAAGYDAGQPYAASDWRRDVVTGRA